MLNALPIRFQDSSGSPFVSLQSPSSLSGNVALTLPSSITNGGFLQTDGSGNLSFSIVEGVPTGSVFCLAVNSLLISRRHLKYQRECSTVLPFMVGGGALRDGWCAAFRGVSFSFFFLHLLPEISLFVHYLTPNA